MYILFSPVGKTDPITNYHDGSMIHICRKYHPQKVYLFLSQEMLAFHQQDNRYCLCLQWLKEKENFHCDIVTIEQPDLVDVQVFDYFYDVFERELQAIKQENPEAIILLNVSSGTPAMKSALQFLAATSDNMYIPVQVSTPQKGVNREQYDFEEYDLAVRWELNEDNQPPVEDRCTESKTATLNKRIKIEVICQHIKAYDYQAAYRVAKSIEKMIPPETMALLDGASKRFALDLSNAQKAFQKAGCNPIPLLSSDLQPIAEYLLWLQVKQQRGDLADFIRGLTPVFVDLFMMALKEKCQLDFRKFCSADKQGVLTVQRSKLKKDPDLLNYLDKYFNSKGGLQNGPLYAIHLVKVFEQKCTDTELVKIAQDLRTIEQKARNPAAHDIVSVTEDWLQKTVGYRSDQIMRLLKNFTQRTCKGIRAELWSSYDEMNESILSRLTTLSDKE